MTVTDVSHGTRAVMSNRRSGRGFFSPFFSPWAESASAQMVCGDTVAGIPGWPCFWFLVQTKTLAQLRPHFPFLSVFFFPSLSFLVAFLIRGGGSSGPRPPPPPPRLVADASMAHPGKKKRGNLQADLTGGQMLLGRPPSARVTACLPRLRGIGAKPRIPLAVPWAAVLAASPSGDPVFWGGASKPERASSKATKREGGGGFWTVRAGPDAMHARVSLRAMPATLSLPR